MARNTTDIKFSLQYWNFFNKHCAEKDLLYRSVHTGKNILPRPKESRSAVVEIRQNIFPVGTYHPVKSIYIFH